MILIEVDKGRCFSTICLAFDSWLLRNLHTLNCITTYTYAYTYPYTNTVFVIL